MAGPSLTAPLVAPAVMAPVSAGLGAATVAAATAMPGVVPASFSSGGWTVGLSYSGTSELTFTATVNQPLDGSGLYLELFELTMTGQPGGIEYLGWCTSGTSCSKGPTAPHATVGRYVAVLGHTLANTYAGYSQAQKVAESDVVSPPPWTLSLSGTTATTNYDVGAAGVYVEIFDLGRTYSAWTTTGYLGWCTSGTVCQKNPGIGPYAATVGGLSNWPLPSGLLAVTYSAPSLDEQGGATSALENCVACFPADPVNSMTGTLVESFTDVSVSSRGPGLSWGRTYVSSLAGTDGPLGYGWSLEYGSRLEVSDVEAVFVDGGGARTTFTRYPDGSWVAPSRVLASLTENQDGTFTLTRDGTGKTWEFTGAGVLTAVTDRSGLATTLGYASGQLSTVTDDAGRALTLSWTGSRIHTVTDPANLTTTYTYDAAGNLWKVTDPENRVTEYGYDTSHELTDITDPYGNHTHNVYTGGQVSEQSDPAGLTTTFAYTGSPMGDTVNDTPGTTTITDGHGAVSVHRYRMMQLVSETTASGTSAEATTSYAYDPATMGVATTTDPLGHVTRQSFDDRGNVLTHTDPTGRGVTYTYDAWDHRTSQVLPSGRQSDWSYTSGGTLTDLLQSVTTKNNSTVIGTTTYTHGDSSHPTDVTSITDADGRVTTLTYTAHGEVATSSVTNNASRVSTTQYGYDADGRVVCTVTPEKYATGLRCPATGTPPAGASSLVYDGSGRVTSRTDALGHTTTYAYSGRATTVTDAENHATRQVVDQDGREVTATTGYGSATAATTTTGYDIAAGTGACPSTTGVAWCTTVTDPQGRVSVHGFDAAGNEVRTIRPGGHTTATSYDLAGLPEVVTNPDGTTTTYGFDGAGRVLSKDYSTNSPADVTYTYDSDGRRASMSEATSPVHATDYTYGDLGLLASVTQKDGATTTSTVSYGRDATGHVTTITYPDNRVVTHTYDTAGELASILDGAGGRTTGFGYDRDGNLTGTTFAGSAGSISSTFDATGAMTGTTAKDGTGSDLLSLTYTRTGTGQVASETATGAATSGGSYGYTSNNRLDGAGATSFGYDLAGNPTGLGGTTQTFNSSDGSLATSDAAGTMQAFGYDANGDRTAAVGDVTSTYTYDQASQLASSQTSLTPASAGEFTPLSPARILDTRYGIGAPTAPVAGHGTVHLQVTGAGGVPATGVAAVVLNVTDVNAAGNGWVRVFPTGETPPSTSTMNWNTGEVNANLVMVKVGTGGQVDLYNGSSSAVDLFADVAGYYVDAPSSDGAGAYVPVTATRVSDSTVAAATATTVNIAGANGVPADAAAAVVNLTAVASASHGGYLTAYPAGTSRPTASNLNVAAGDTTANLAVVKIGTNGDIEVYNGSTGATRIIIDLVGYYTGGPSTLPGGYVPLNPARILDTRNGQTCATATNPIPSHGTVDVQVTGAGAVPTSGVAAAVVNLTAVCGSTTGWVTAYPADQTRPTASNMNWAAGEIVAVLAMVPVSADGKIRLYNGSSGTVQLVADIEGYITTGSNITGTVGPTTTYTHNGDGLRLTKTTNGQTTTFVYDVSGSVPSSSPTAPATTSTDPTAPPWNKPRSATTPPTTTSTTNTATPAP